MSAPKRGLGRGLGALLGEAPVPVTTSHEIVREIPVTQITPNPFQPRKSFEAGALDELKTSIAEYGVLVPIIVRRRGDGYELIAGERRWRACAALLRPTIPAIVRASDDRQTLEFAIVENLQRENLNPLEEAAGFHASHGRVRDDARGARSAARQEPPGRRERVAAPRALGCDKSAARRRTALGRTRARTARGARSQAVLRWRSARSAKA